MNHITKFIKKNKYIKPLLILVAIILLLIILYGFSCKNVIDRFDNYNTSKCNAIVNTFEKDGLYEKIKNIDIVYMWIDGSDSNWQKKTKLKNSSRHKSNGELIYSLRSFDKFAKWHEGRIFIVSPPGQKHPDLNYDGKKLIYVNQYDIIPKEAGNTANSFIFEVYLWKIPDLSEYFIYMNDDYFFGKPTKPSDFFGLNNKGELIQKFYSNNFKLSGGEKQADEFMKKRKKLWYSATLTTNGLLNNEYKNESRHFMEHAPYVFRKSDCKEIYNKWTDKFISMNNHKQRHWKDIIFVYLYRYYCIYENKPAEIIHETDNISFKIIKNNNNENKSYYKKLCESCPKFITLNDEFNKKDVMEEMKKFLSDFYPEKSRFEK